MAEAKNSKTVVTPLILCGGAGSRLWPMSRPVKPKQFHALFDNRTLLEHTLARVLGSMPGDFTFSAPCIVANRQFGDLLKPVLRSVPSARLVLEPSIRDTAPAIAACTHLYDIAASDSILLVLPSDAHIPDADAFLATVERAARIAAQTDAIMTIGITPDRPETQYGYIEIGPALGDGFVVKRFCEKPDAQTAATFFESKQFLWNAGMFLFRAGRMADEFRTRQPAIWDSVCGAVAHAKISDNSVWLDGGYFEQADKISIDYAIMEQAENVGVVPATFAWDDLGSWSQLYQHAQKDDDKNATAGDVILVEASGNYVRTDDAVVALAGVDDLVVVAEAGNVLVTKRASAHLVKPVSEAFKARFSSKSDRPRTAPAVRDWLFDTCMPFWADRGVDHVRGGVHEVLDFGGDPSSYSFKRLRVLARQIYAFAHAEHLGWDGVPDGLLERLFETLVTSGWHQDEGGFIHAFNPDGTVRDDRRDFYDHSFALLALAWLYRGRGLTDARQWADKALQWLDVNLADARGGYLEDSLGARPRRANPHMHFLEAMLAWHHATGEAAFLDRAETMVSLFQTRFFDPQTGTLTEFFADDWGRIHDGTTVTAVEPGHHYEWAWLLLKYLDLRPTPGLEAKARTLFATARAFGHHVATGAAADGVEPDGQRLSNSARLWPQTEALKAATAFEKRGLAGAEIAKDQALDVLFTHYLGQPQPGGWMDVIDAQGRPVAAQMPASSLYHVVAALAEFTEP